MPATLAPPETAVVNKPEPKVDAIKLAKGRAVFADDMEMPGMLYGGLLTSPHAHARILNIDASKALALPGVHAVLTHEDVERVIYASGGQSYPQPPPYDQVSLDNKVRHVGDRVAVVAAETPGSGAAGAGTDRGRVRGAAGRLRSRRRPCSRARRSSTTSRMPRASTTPNTMSPSISSSTMATWMRHWPTPTFVYESEYRVQQVQQAHIEPHIVLTWWDEDDRLVIRTSTQVPFHVRRMIAPLIGLPVRRIRVVKPRIGGGFGGKQEMLVEDLVRPSDHRHRAAGQV